MLRTLLACSLFLLGHGLRAAAVPDDLAAALAAFRAEGTPGWAFVQKTEGRSDTLIERYDPSRPRFARWTLVSKNGQPPTDEERKRYDDTLSRRPREETAPNVKNQIRPETCELLGEENGRARFRFQLKPAAEDDRSAEYMTVTFSLHRPTGTIERVELANREPFSPMFGVKIEEANTVVDYSLPEGTRPTLLQRIHVRVRGRAMFFKSLDQEMRVTYSEYKQTAPEPASQTNAEPAPSPAS